MGIFASLTYSAEMKAELIAAKGHHYMGFDIRKAITFYDKAIRKYPDYFRTYSYRAFAKIQLGDYQGAIKDCNLALLLNPQFDQAYIDRANAKEYDGNLAGALTDCDTAIKINPNNANAYYRRGIILEQLGEKERAISDFKIAKVKGEILADLELDRLQKE